MKSTRAPWPLRPVLRRSLAVVLGLVFVACASNASKDDDMVGGRLGTGGSMSGERAGGVPWALRVEGEDVVLQVDGALARFVGGAADGWVEFEHSRDARTWNLELDGGLVHSRFHELTVNGTAHSFEPGISLLFGPDGRLLQAPIHESVPR